MTRVTFYYDPISPFAYMAYVILSRYRTLWNIKEIDLKPVFLPAVIKEAENRPPMTIPNKGKYMVKDMRLQVQFFKMDFTLPPGFPNAVKTVNAVRFLRQLKDDHPDASVLEAATLRFWECVFGSNKRDINDIKTYPEILKDIKGLSADQIASITKSSQSEANKERVKQEPGQMVKDTLSFGMPWIMVERDDGAKHTFWGSDRMELMAYWLQKPWYGPVPSTQAKL